jgi:hypothetical protein
MRSTPHCVHVPVALFTSSLSPSDTECAEQLGVSRCIRKPTELGEFFNVVHLAIRELT